jgi:hypothetical protein
VTFGHTAALSGNTVFIQGGTLFLNRLSKASYAIILDKDGSLSNATWLDTSRLSVFTPRGFGVAVATDNTLITCGGTQDGARGTGMTCDQLDTTSYNVTRIEPTEVSNRYGMAATYQKTSDGIKAYFTGSSNSTKRDAWTADIVTMKTSTLSSAQWSKGPDMLGILPRKFHTATWADAPLNGIVMMGGQADDIVTLPLTPAIVYDPIASGWSSV